MNVHNIVKIIQPCRRASLGIFRTSFYSSNNVAIKSQQTQRLASSDTKNVNDSEITVKKTSPEDDALDAKLTDSEISQDEEKRQKRMRETGRHIIKDQVPVHGYQVTDYDKFCLVYLGRYPTMFEVPPFVPTNKIKLCHDLMRIRYSIWSILFFSVFALFTIWSYERDRKRYEAEYMAKHYNIK